MLVIRLQRIGRSGISHFRVIAQEKRFSPVSGKILANLGTYNPHTKEATLDTEAIKKYLADGAQPSDRLKKLFKAEKITLPGWVVPPLKRKKAPKKVVEPKVAAPKAEAVVPEEQVEEKGQGTENPPSHEASEDLAQEAESTEQEETPKPEEAVKTEEVPEVEAVVEPIEPAETVEEKTAEITKTTDQ